MPQCAHSGCVRTPRWWQRRSGVGATLDEAWFCSQPCIEAVLLERLTGVRVTTHVVRRLPGVRLGALLRLHKACPPEQIAAYFTECFRDYHRQLGLDEGQFESFLKAKQVSKILGVQLISFRSVFHEHLFFVFSARLRTFQGFK